MQREVHDRIPRAPRNKPNETWNESNQPCLPEFAGKVDLIYIDPPFDTGADFSYTTAIPDSA